MFVLLGLITALLQLMDKKATSLSKPTVSCEDDSEDRHNGNEVDDEITDHCVAPCEK
jgi:hypothetical protein